MCVRERERERGGGGESETETETERQRKCVSERDKVGERLIEKKV